MSNVFDVTLSTEDRLSKAKIQLHKQYPFFSYLVEHLRLIADPECKHLPVKTMGVDEKGRLYYYPAFVDGLTEAQLRGVLAHEVMHPALRHIPRKGSRDVLVNGYPLFFVASDVSVNHILSEEGVELPKEAILPKDGKVTVYNVKIENIGDKSTEEIYDELLAGCKQQVKQGKMKMVGGASGNDMSNGGKPEQGFDEHLDSGEGSGDQKEDGEGSGAEGGDQEAEGVPEGAWGDIVAEAMEHAKRIGRLPASMQRQFDDLHKHKVNWRAVIRRTVASKIPFDYSYARPNRRYLPHDIFMPTLHGESVKVICSIDTSGSISQKELNDFVSEMIGIARSFSHVEFRVLSHDVEVHDDLPIANGAIQKLKNMKVHGGGGTSHKPLYEYIKKRKRKWDINLLVSFTDGWSDFPEKRPGVETLFVLAGAHTNKENMPKWARTICVD